MKHYFVTVLLLHLYYSF